MSEPTVEEYTIGWICALQVEYEAACRMLDDEFDGPETAEINDNNTYVFGRVSGHCVVIGCLPHGRYGTSSAASVAKDMIRCFLNLKFALMVGIGGGAPTQERDIRLGDVVVSVPQGALGGVVQYDFGKRLTGGRFQQTGQLNAPPEVLLGALPEMQRRHNDPRKPDKIAEHIRLMDDMPDYSRPVDDVLYRADYEHKGGQSCADCDTSGLVDRAPRNPKREVIVHYGIIASANSVMKSAVERDQYAKDRSLNVLCFEMEAGGLMNSFPCLVIRGICDYSDSHKNDDWHKYAAVAAAAYARELLHIVKPRKVAALAPWTKVEGLLADIQEGVESVIHHQHTQQAKMILEWLTPINYGPQQSDFLSRRQPGSGQWLLDSNEYQTWLKNSHQTLFCPGIPGAGKTILTSVVVNELFEQFQRDPDAGIAYIYCNFKRWDEQKAEHLLASLLKQFVQERSSLPDSVRALYEQHSKKQTRPSMDQISEALHSILALYSRTFIIVDALDECQALDGCRDKFLSVIFSLQSECGANIFATSRFFPDITAKFKEGLSIEIRATVNDVGRYLESRMSQLPVLKYATDSVQLQEEIKSGVLKAVDGMFLLAQLHLDSLAGRTSPKAIRNALKTLPTGSDAYDRAYKGAMERIEGQYNEQGRLARRVISWITCSRRPLTTFELQHALAVEFGTRLLDQENISSIQLMVSVCAGLVTADERSDIIRLIHYTTQEYFERTRNHWFPEAETEITKVCVTYLSFDVFGSESCQTHFALNRLLARNRLFDYAACNWGHHARMSSIEDDELILDLLESGRNLSVCTWAMVSSRYNKGTWWLRKIRPRMAALHATAYFGLRRSTAALLNRGYSPNPEDHLGCTPLYYATDKGYLEVAKILLERGADPNIRCSNSHGPTRITRAMMKGDLELVMSLLSRNSFPNIQEDYIEYDSTPLHHATKNGYLELVELLLEKNADPNVQDDKGYGSTPLHYATRNGNMELVKLLLENNADPNFQDDGLGCGWTPLHYATMNEHLELVKLLLEWNSNPNVQENGIGYGLTPLHYATENGHLELVKLLLEKGANPNILGGSVESGPAPLHYATWNGNIELVELLLEKNADPNLQEDAFGCGSTPLHYATQDGHLELVKLLLEKGADPNIQDHGIGHSLTALHYATSLGHLELVYLLLHNNANPNIQDQHGLSPLHCAARVGNCDMVKLLLDWNADSTVRCHYDLTPLCYATQNGHQKVAGLFGSKGGHHDQANRKRPRLNL